jgi:two-component system alkaline phosphatase synthesis response regulator PhoP
MSPTKPSILVVDDDREIVRLVRSYLEQAGFEVLATYDGESAMYMIRRERPTLVVLDLMLPGEDGWQLTQKIRADRYLSDIPIIMLTARVEDTDKVVGLELGADDYITKPFSPREVVARIRSVLRRSQPAGLAEKASVLHTAGLMMDLGRREVTIDGQPVDLTVTEFGILRTLMENPGYAFTRSELIEQSLGYNYEGLERTLDSHIKNLRRKIEPDPKEPDYIQTIYGIGYRLVGP